MFSNMRLYAIVTICAALMSAGCSSSQPVKNVWKGAKGVWHTYVSPPAGIDYNDKGDMEAHERALARRMMEIDVQLGELERVMTNADKPPTAEWLAAFFKRFPWIDGFAGVKAGGEIIGQEPGPPLKPLDFSPLLQEGEKQNLRALRGHVQDTPMGPEVFLATPLYDSQNFLGVVAAYFDMRNLLRYSVEPGELIVFSPGTLLWAGKYDYASTPLASVDWAQTMRSATKGVVSNDGGTFYWVTRYFGNTPLIFAVAVQGNFTEKENSLTGPTSDKEFPVPAPVAPMGGGSFSPKETIGQEAAPAEVPMRDVSPANASKPARRKAPAKTIKQSAPPVEEIDSLDMPPPREERRRPDFKMPSPFGPKSKSDPAEPNAESSTE